MASKTKSSPAIMNCRQLQQNKPHSKKQEVALQ